MLRVNEIFYSLQGEGGRSGRPTVFVRLSGCNLSCPWCDTQHEKFEEMEEEQVVRQVLQFGCSWVCITGGEPLIQKIDDLISLLHQENLLTQIETNGVLISEREDLWGDVDLVTVSPKYRERPTDGVQTAEVLKARRILRETEFKLVVGIDENDRLENQVSKLLEATSSFCSIYLQPESEKKEAIERCVQLVKKCGSERVRISLQLQKIACWR